MAKKPALLTQVRTALGHDHVGRKKGGTFIVRRQFFYTHGFTAEKFEEQVRTALKAAGLTIRVVESYEHWTRFRGGASVANQSHWGCEFVVLEGEVKSPGGVED